MVGTACWSELPHHDTIAQHKYACTGIAANKHVADQSMCSTTIGLHCSAMCLRVSVLLLLPLVDASS